ncbi:probable DEAD-box ATP-dependent RNA helicase 48 [Juglans microcarpa x Juglans regia]|uniref:probable DEAD-box ATP-dependent RNA helicase 48 n=1 Tax=Juglans microcarpa x Juglans regia TaxID=2249226 RepID=UPI001B7DEC7F|nr:probable DEAD-box ATP-dependent RNA helicase 48 [Juglans microcarpa x Juglans regia]
MSILQNSLSIQTLPQQLSFSKALTGPTLTFFRPKLSYPFLQSQSITTKTTTIRMGGGPRTYPGGVSKWQWKRMQAKKSKQLLKARLCRERQIYEMRKRAELKAAVSELERPWEVVERAPNLLSVDADEQVKVLADRFQRPGGFDLWTERDGPQLFNTVDDLPSARFFPKGVVHSIKPYRRNAGFDELNGVEEGLRSDSGNGGAVGEQKNAFKSNRRSIVRKSTGASSSEWEGQGLDGSEMKGSYRKSNLEASEVNSGKGKTSNGKLRKNDNRRFASAGSNGSSGLNYGQVGFDRKQRGKGSIKRGYELNDSHSDVYDMNLQEDGRFKFQPKNGR